MMAFYAALSNVEFAEIMSAGIQQGLRPYRAEQPNGEVWAYLTDSMDRTVVSGVGLGEFVTCVQAREDLTARVSKSMKRTLAL
jgi:hypothetical protein